MVEVDVRPGRALKAARYGALAAPAIAIDGALEFIGARSPEELARRMGG